MVRFDGVSGGTEDFELTLTFCVDSNDEDDDDDDVDDDVERYGLLRFDVLTATVVLAVEVRESRVRFRNDTSRGSTDVATAVTVVDCDCDCVGV